MLVALPFMAMGQQSAAEKAIRAQMDAQITAWNNGDLEAFMGTYWQNDSITFIGKDGVTYGWQRVLDRYKRNFPDRAAMGTLSFKILHVKVLSKNRAYVVGRWFLKREKDAPEGYYSLLFAKIKGKWLIISDHSS